MKRILDATALALVWTLGVGIVLFGPRPAQAAGCVPIAALDLNGDGWIDGPERHAALNAGFTNVRSDGRLYTTDAEMSACLQGSQHAFNWLQSGQGVSSVDAGAIYDTPQAQAEAHAKAYLEHKVFGAGDSAVTRSAAPQPLTAPPAPVAEPLVPMASPSPDFALMDANGDGVVSREEYLAYVNRPAQGY